MGKIISIGTAVPKHASKQGAILDFMHDAYNSELTSRKLDVLFNKSGIATRYSVIPDFDKGNNEHVFFNGTPSKADVEDRINVFKERALPLALKAIDNALYKINTSIDGISFTHLITVSCTGLYAPGLDTELIEAMNLPKDIYRTSVNFLGCNAAFHAMKIADMILKTNANARVLVVCVELCTIHFQAKENHDNLLSNTIFGDGAAALIIAPNSYEKRGLKLLDFYSVLLSEGKHLMGWNITPRNFEMILDAKIPDFIGSSIKAILKNAVQKFQISAESITKYAIHPGGKKIIDVIKNKFGLNTEDVNHSYHILNRYGNMSSPTILFVLNEIMESSVNKETIFAIGFGPGLSIETALLTYE